LEAQQPAQSQSARISTAAVQLLREYTRRGPTKAKTTIGEDSVVVMLADTLTQAERALVEYGNPELVVQTRHEFQNAMRQDLIGVVERETGRKVVAFMSDIHIDPDLAAEIFALEPVSA